MANHRTTKRGLRIALLTSLILCLTGALAACGGAGSGAGPNGAGQGLILTRFDEDGVDNLSLNAKLHFYFSESLDPTTVTPASIQIREGPSFGVTVPGVLRVEGAVVEFSPRLPGLCDLSDAALKPSTIYRVAVIGNPESFAIRNSRGQPLSQTTTLEFRTRGEAEPSLLTDQLPGEPPVVLSVSPADGSAAVAVEQGNRVVLEMNQNLDPCSVNSTTVSLYQYELGDPTAFLSAPNGNKTGFDSITDASPSLFSWGATNSTVESPAQRIPANIELVQDFESTQIILTPVFGQFPDNALLVMQLTTGIQDFGGQFGVPYAIAFTTENSTPQSSTFVLHYEGEVSLDEAVTTAEVDTPRAPSRAQAYLLFSGDGDNGVELLEPSAPETPASSCTAPRQANDSTKDEFDPTADVILDTGATPNTCPNETDGSTAVVWEFQSFRIRSGVTVRIIGVNPAIILVQGDVSIDSGGTLLARGDGTSGTPKTDGTQGASTYGVPAGVAGGVGVAGGGNGGKSYPANNTVKKGDSGTDGFGSPDVGTQEGTGSGHGNVNSTLVVHNTGPTINSGAGGGGGNATPGGDGGSNYTPGTTATIFEGTPDGKGGNVYGTGDEAKRLLVPFAGSGGGAAGAAYSSYTDERASGGSGGAGGGFVDITALGDILIQGTINASGGRGGAGNLSPWGQEHQSSGGGGGSGGGIRLLTPGNINVSGGTLSAAGGLGGQGAVGTTYPGPRNNGGDGGNGRIALEDSDSVITGLGGATVSPGEGAQGFYRGAFDASRFKGGGIEPSAVTNRFYIGPLRPTFTEPLATDFNAAIPRIASRGPGKTGIVIEMQGYPILPDGLPDLTAGTGWYTVGYFSDSGLETSPTWNAGLQPPDVIITNAGIGIANIDGSGVVQIRVSFYLPPGISPTDGGPYLDRWDIRFQHDQ